MWIEISGTEEGKMLLASRPARALWIEIAVGLEVHQHNQVEAREGLVD